VTAIPEERVEGLVARQVVLADDLAPTVQRVPRSHRRLRAPEGPEVFHLAVLP
jgi:hypothetical protein